MLTPQSVSTSVAPVAAAPLWGARLLLVERATADAKACAEWYGALLGDPVTEVAHDVWQVRGPDRWMLFRTGPPKAVPLVAFAFPTQSAWVEYRAHLLGVGLALYPATPELQGVLGEHTFGLRDPDRRTIVFCVAPEGISAGPSESLAIPPARLQHFVCASTQTIAMLDFYRDLLGYIESDRVLDTEGDLSSAFVRSDAEHHSFAVFRAPQSGADHHAYELPNWNAIRDWADHCGDLEIPLWWGPGRHGVGNNVFFMIEDPDGYKLEFSAELEHMTPEQRYREWPHGPRALNLWGSAWMRS
jgi:catechol 2,3-dioxygenase